MEAECSYESWGSRPTRERRKAAYRAVRPERRKRRTRRERDDWSNVVNPAPYLDPKGRGNNSMVRKGR
jgi:hypothetical protein